MAKRSGFWKNTFGKKFGISDVILLGILVLYPVYVYLNATRGFILINEGVTAILDNIGGYVWSAVFLTYFLYKLIKNAKK